LKQFPLLFSIFSFRPFILTSLFSYFMIYQLMIQFEIQTIYI
jgi:hypothetical protein